jgi:hypothetical protein
VLQFDEENTTGITELSPDLVTIFPNPVKDRINIMAADNGLDLEYLTVYDMTGRVVQQLSEVGEINVIGLKSGIYVAHVQTNRGIIRKRFAKL